MIGKQRKINRKILIFTAILLLVNPVISLSSRPNNMKELDLPILETTDNSTLTFSQNFSKPIVERDGKYCKIIVEEANSYLPNFGAPKIPVFTKTVEMPWNTEIKNIEYTVSEPKDIPVPKKIKPVLSFKFMSSKQIVAQTKTNQDIYTQNEPYPSDWVLHYTGAGLNSSKLNHVLFLNLHIYPARYKANSDQVEYIKKVNVTITYEVKPGNIFSSNEEEYDLLIISPDDYAENLQPLVEHKNTHNIKTNVSYLKHIYSSYQGIDKPAKIKYFIKQAVENWNISYVLLIGDIKRLPRRYTQAYPWNNSENNILSDLYYADIYNSNYSFCNWDSNWNQSYGEVEYNISQFPFKIKNIDQVDLYPDVVLGRLPVRNSEELDQIIDKIITYETTTYNQNWFKRIILAGGDTFPLSKGSKPFTFEGETVTKQVAEQLPNFKHIFLWATKRTLGPLTFNRAINNGAGFISYSGHGFEHGWGTYRPNAILDHRLIRYYTPYLQFLRNQHKLPIVFFDACLTCKLDFNMSDIEKYFPLVTRIIHLLTGVNYDPTNYYPCFAYSFINQPHGGAIATIGATRSAYTLVDNDGIYAGASYLNVNFFKAYKPNTTLGKMFTSSQNKYLNHIGKDYFTLEEFVILGDPSLKVGGCP